MSIYSYYYNLSMNTSKINECIQKEQRKYVEQLLINISIHYNLNKKELIEKFLDTKKNFKKYKNKKKHIDPQYICMAKTQTGAQCSRSKKFGDYCGKHSIHKDKCLLEKYIPNSERSEKEEKEYCTKNIFHCKCNPKLGRILHNSSITIQYTKNNSNHLIVKNERIRDTLYNVESDTQIVFDTNTKQPTVIGKKLSDNEIFFLSDIELEHDSMNDSIHDSMNDSINTINHTIKPTKEPIQTSNDSNDSNDSTQTLDTITNSITDLLTKHNVGYLEESFDAFTINKGPHVSSHSTPYTQDTTEDDIDILDDINAELGLY